LKPKILLRAMAARRDAGYCIVLKALFEHYGFEVFISCTRNFEFSLKFWKPDIVIVSSLTKAQIVKKMLPDSFLVYLEGEGIAVNYSDMADHAVKHHSNLKLFNLILLWGDAAVNCFKKYKDETGIVNVHAIGNPKMDLVRYLPLNKIKIRKKSIGFITRFNIVNHHLGRPALVNVWKENQFNFAISSVKTFHTMHKAITLILENTNHNVSIRPHPHESPNFYYKYVLPSFSKFKDRVEIDENLFIPEWIAKQKCIVSTTTTTFIESYVMKTPMINLDYISNTYKWYKDYSKFSSEWVDAAFLPKSLNALIKLIDKKLIVKKDKKIEKQLNEGCDFNKGNSALHNCVKIIKKNYKQKKLNLGLPLFLLELYDSYVFKKALKKEPLHKNFSYAKNYHKTPSYVKDFVLKILKNDLNEF
tara:strand:- start:3636 stop:4886 length:1251 start_codon:yes stop_codon:yes gene_type:complete